MEPQNDDTTKTNDTFTFMYCFMHDDGFIIQGNHDYVPYGYVMQHSQTCECCDWYNMGVIEIKNDEITVIKSVRVNYDRYGGGFIFRLYIGTLTDDKGKYIDLEDDCILYQWIEYINDTCKNIYLDP